MFSIQNQEGHQIVQSALSLNIAFTRVMSLEKRQAKYGTPMCKLQPGDAS